MTEHSAEEPLEQIYRAEFQPGWPSVHPTGLVSIRLIVQPIDADMPPGVSWTLRSGLSTENAPRVAFIAELAVITEEHFAGHTVVMPAFFRDEPDSIDHDYADEQLEQYGGWASSIMYDFAAQGLRAMVAGHMGATGSGISVPFLTPDVKLILSEDEDELGQPFGDDVDGEPTEDDGK